MNTRAVDLQSFGADLDAIRDRVKAQIGAEDVAYIKRVERASRGFELVGRTLIHVSVEPAGFLTGVTFLWLHKQLQATEIGHTALHGAYDKLENAERYDSKTFRWETPIDEESWRETHNVRHHGFTNIVGKDPDTHWGPLRLNSELPWRPHNQRQVGYAALLATQFTAGINLQYTGAGDYLDRRSERTDFIGDRSPQTRRKVLTRLLRKFVPYYGREYVMYPALAGPFFWKVLLGNWMTEVMRDIYSAATIYCGHVGEEVADYPEGTKAGSRAEWYLMQVQATNDFEVPLPVSILCGALDRQVEHHLFPRFPPNRLRQIAPEVRAVCEAHGVPYRTDTWPNTLRKVFARFRQLGRPDEPSVASTQRASLAA
ncbi:MAG TPA: acyl-CoA desaturase [Kofleriaceae bacterium]|nr:acyl-CoA desaturase [Kofleriaceae bacterium]